MFYTFFGICKKHDAHPWQWMKKVLEIIPDHMITRLEELLPQNLMLEKQRLSSCSNTRLFYSAHETLIYDQ